MRRIQDVPSVEWVVHSVPVPHHDAARRLEQAFRVLLGVSPGVGNVTHRRLTHDDRFLCPGFDRSAEPRADD
jgi:hypothetical protein